MIDHLAAHGAGFTGSQVTVIAIGQVNADFLSCLHLEAVHGLTGLGNVQLIVVRVAHFDSLLFVFSGKARHFPDGECLFVRSPILTKVDSCMSGEWRKKWVMMPEYQNDSYVPVNYC